MLCLPKYLKYKYFFSFRINVGSGAGSGSGSDFFLRLSRIREKKIRILIPGKISYWTSENEKNCFVILFPII